MKSKSSKLSRVDQRNEGDVVSRGNCWVKSPVDGDGVSRVVKYSVVDVSGIWDAKQICLSAR